MSGTNDRIVYATHFEYVNWGEQTPQAYQCLSLLFAYHRFNKLDKAK